MRACSLLPTSEAAVIAAATDSNLDNIAAWSSPGRTLGFSSRSMVLGSPKEVKSGCVLRVVGSMGVFELEAPCDPISSSKSCPPNGSNNPGRNCEFLLDELPVVLELPNSASRFGNVVDIDDRTLERRDLREIDGGSLRPGELTDEESISGVYGGVPLSGGSDIIISGSASSWLGNSGESIGGNGTGVDSGLPALLGDEDPGDSRGGEERE